MLEENARMDPIERLMAEHRLIEKVLDSLEAYVRELSHSESPDKRDLQRFVTFIRWFADRCHHGKEEDILFAEMVEAGFPRQAGPIGVMLAEHEEGRRLVRQLAEDAKDEAPCDAEARHRIQETAKSFASLLRAHISKEDQVLYPMALSRLGPEAMARIGERFERFEAEKMGEGTHERLHAEAEDLIARHAPSVLAGGGGACCR